MIDGGPTGINFTGGATTATLTNTTIAGTSGDAMTGRVATLEMTGGELRDNARGGIEVVGGRWTFTNVGIKGNPVFGVDLRGGGATTPGTLVMHGSTVTGNGTGVYLFDNAIANLGTAAIPGNNTTQGNAGVGLSIDGISGPTNIDAAGNTWRPNVQGASAQGTYAAVLLNGPVLVANANNFSIAKGWTLKF
jgi:hypothetical protein